jgi:DNA-binding beta-propeller fold protein YncE
MNRRTVVFMVAVALAFSPVSAQSLFGVNGGSGGGFSSPGAFVRIDPLTGAATVLGTPMPGLGLTGVAVDPQGRIFASTGTTDGATNGPRLIRIDPATGALLADVGRLQTAGGDDCYIGDLSFQPGTGALFGILGNQGPSPRCGIPEGGVGGYLLTINTSTARVTVVGRDASLGNSNGGLAFGATSGTLFFTPCWSNPGAILTLNPATAAIAATVPLQDAGTCYMGLAFRPSDGKLWASYDYENEDNNIYTLDPATGARQLVGSPGDYLVHDVVWQEQPAEAIPALSGWALVGLAALLLLTGTFAILRLRA